ncbi:hypothetical protein DFQ09_109192 [Winogradskyella pacifica]|uniref:Calx-beta domain-containing protein n=1 Tax=Winogradskyella pacifica TaxID=664642 RepID=A0A3D9LN94_9FLAO|nr:hypothetical protein [Winogradskyella pacifica]REE08126.1 hypothetical protein DFQ09_109192 [Winogradskyella pacifica]
MKNIFKISFLFSLLLVSFNSCDSSEGENEGKFNESPESGWVQFQTSQLSIDLGGYDVSVPAGIPVEVNVPIVANDLTISYSFVPVSGANPNTVFSNTGNLLSPGGTSSNFDTTFPEIQLNIAEVTAANITETMVFDVVLNGTDNSGIAIGISGTEETRPTTIRVTICPEIEVAIAGLLANDDFFVGDYNLTVTSGDSLFGGDVFADQTVTVTADAGAAFNRSFDVAYAPGGNIVSIGFNINSDGQIVVQNDISTGIACAAGEDLTIGGDSANIFTLDACTVAESESVTLNMLDFFGGSGGCGVENIELTVVLTKI